MTESANEFSVTPLTINVGAVIGGIDMARPLAPQQVEQVRRALLDHGVLFFRNQIIDDEQMMAFTANFSAPAPEPLMSAERGPDAPKVGTGDQGRAKHATAVWHTDTTFVAEPPTLTILRAVKPRQVGGDTLWASMGAAYDALSPAMCHFLDGLTATHSMAPVIERMGPEMAKRYLANEQAHGGREFVHPLVMVHPETGRKVLFYNEGWTTRILELTAAESERITGLLREHIKSPIFSCRWKWEANDVAFWDNRAVQHFAVPDYDGERIMQRLVTEGWRPAGTPAAAIAA